MQYGQQSANAINPYPAQAGSTAPVPRTIASAIGRMDSLNDRLSKVRAQLEAISDQIGGPRPAVEKSIGDASPEAVNAVGKLNDSADFAHNYLTEIEGLLGSIGRALG